MGFQREEGGRTVCVLTRTLKVLVFCGLEERYYQNDLLAMISLPSNSFQAGVFLQGRKRRAICGGPSGALQVGLDPLPLRARSASQVAPDGLFQEKRDILHKKRLPRLALVLLRTEAEVPL